MVNKISLIMFALIVLITIISGCNATPPQPDSDRIKSDLIGRVIDENDDCIGWSFKDLSEFEEVKICGKYDIGDVTEYHLALKLKDLNTNREYIGEALFLYKLGKTDWEVFALYPIYLMENPD
jgi:glycine betaine/choline ABC-type transport system substrate-binding protein